MSAEVVGDAIGTEAVSDEMPKHHVARLSSWRPRGRDLQWVDSNGRWPEDCVPDCNTCGVSEAATVHKPDRSGSLD